MVGEVAQARAEYCVLLIGVSDAMERQVSSTE